MLLGIGMIVLGIVLSILTAFWGALYIPFGMLFALITSTQWAKGLFEAAGFRVGEFYLFFAAGIFVCFLLSQVSEQVAGVFGGLILAILFILTGLLAFPGPAAFIAAHVVPVLQAIYLRAGALMFLFLFVALLPISIVFTWFFSLWG